MLQFLRANRRWIAGGFLLTMFSSFGQTFFIGLSGNDIRARFDLSGGEFGLVYMAATLAAAFALPFVGRSLDLMPGWKVVRFVLPGLALGGLLMGLAANVAWLVLALFLLRLFGQGMMTHVAYTEVGRWFAANRGRATSLVVPGHQAGEALFPLLFVLAAGWIGWQGAWIAVAGLTFFVAFPAILLLLRVERTPRTSVESIAPPRTARDWTRAEVLRDPFFYLLLAGLLGPPFIGTSIFFHQGYLIELRGYDPLEFAAAFPLMAASTVTFALASGQLIDRFGALRLLPFFLLPLILASLVLALATPAWAFQFFMVLFGVSYGFTATMVGALWPEVYGVAHLGGVRALIVSIMVFATALGPGITGALIDLGIGLPEQLLWTSGWCLAASFLLALAARHILAREAGHKTAG